MNMNWDYIQPVKIVFGNGRISELSKYLNDIQKPLLITGPFFVKSPLIQQIKEACGISFVFSDISPNPDVEQVNACSALIRREGIDGIVAIGGGSTIDLAKAASLGAEHIEDYHTGGKPIPDEHLPVIAVPTTSGTGSEVTSVSVLTDRKKGRKAPMSSVSFYPALALVDPEITRSLSPRLTAISGMDVLCHAVEGYWSRGHQPICDTLAAHAIRLVIKYLPIAFAHPDDLRAREKMAEASVIAGLAFSLPKTTSSHACSFPLTNIYGIPHGEACALTLDYFIKVNGEDEHVRKLLDDLGYASAEGFAQEVAALKKTLELRHGLKDLNLSEEQIEELVQASHHPNMLNNPVDITDDILLDMYKKLAEQ